MTRCNWGRVKALSDECVDAFQCPRGTDAAVLTPEGNLDPFQEPGCCPKDGRRGLLRKKGDDLVSAAPFLQHEAQTFQPPRYQTQNRNAVPKPWSSRLHGTSIRAPDGGYARLHMPLKVKASHLVNKKEKK